MKIFSLIGLALTAWLTLSAGAVAASSLPASIEVVTEDAPPFQYVENGKLVGRTTDVVRLVLEDAGIKGKFDVLPWPRAMSRAQEGENVLIYTIDRTEERERQFQWIGEIASGTNHFFALKASGLKIADLDQARKYMVGTVIGDSRERYLIERGFRFRENIESVPTSEQNYLKLKAGRITLWPMNDIVLPFVVRKMGGDPTELEPVLEMPNPLNYAGSFMALSLKSSPALVAKLRQSLEHIKADGRFAAIQANWSR